MCRDRKKSLKDMNSTLDSLKETTKVLKPWRTKLVASVSKALRACKIQAVITITTLRWASDRQLTFYLASRPYLAVKLVKRTVMSNTI